MSILIKGMTMPKNCEECRFNVDGWCYVCKPQSEEERKRITTNYCPLIEGSSVVSREEYEGLELVCKNYEEALKDAVDELEKSGRKRGKIIINEFGNESCSVCHYGLVLFITDENNTLKKPNYCPNCGADMRYREES